LIGFEKTISYVVKCKKGQRAANRQKFVSECAHRYVYCRMLFIFYVSVYNLKRLSGDKCGKEGKY